MSNKIKKPFHPSLIFDSIHLKEVESHLINIWELCLVVIIPGIYIQTKQWKKPIQVLVYCEGLSTTQIGELYKKYIFHSSDRFQNMPILYGIIYLNNWSIKLKAFSQKRPELSREVIDQRQDISCIKKRAGNSCKNVGNNYTKFIIT